ncbi:hypothetical protein Ancab_033796 [Ancistrocladus abbreviatus]
MQRSVITRTLANIQSQSCDGIQPMVKLNPRRRGCDVFINHRGVDTKKNVAGLLDNHLRSLGLNPFLDCKNMKPGDKIIDGIESGIRNCKVGVAVFSPRYTESYFCLRELAFMMECKKKVIPIFCNVRPSDLLRQVGDQYGSFTVADFHRFHWALKEARHTVGVTFDTLTGDWPEFLAKATEVIVEGLLEADENYHRDNFKGT